MLEDLETISEPFRGAWQASNNHMKVRILFLALLLVLANLTGCQVNDIIIDVSTKEGDVVMRVHYDGSSDPVGLTEVLVQESKETKKGVGSLFLTVMLVS